MSEIHRNPAERTDVGKPEVSSVEEIKPQASMSLSEAKAFIENLFREKQEAADGHYVSYKDRFDHVPADGGRGQWEGEEGESKYIPSDSTEEGRAALEKLSEKGEEGIEYKDAEPDFSKCAEAAVEIDDMTEHRHDYDDADGNTKKGNFSQADCKCAEQWNAIGKDGKTDWTAADVRDWRREHNCSWHERCDTRTMDLVPREIHGYFRHSGGCAECRARDAIYGDGGGFDE